MLIREYRRTARASVNKMLIYSALVMGARAVRPYPWIPCVPMSMYDSWYIASV